MQVPLDDPALADAARWKVLRVWDTDESWDEWVIIGLADDQIEGRSTITAGPFSLLLGRAGLVTETVSDDGIVRPEIERVGLPPATLLRTLVIEPCTALGLAWVLAGDVTSTVPTDVSLKWTTPLVALTTIATAAALEIDGRRVGVTGYAIDLVARVGVAEPTLHVRYARNLTALAQDAQATDHATVLAVQGAESDGIAATMARAVWTVSSIVGPRVVLADPANGTGPVGWDAQLTDLALWRDGSTLLPIIDSRATDSSVVLADVDDLAIGDVVEVRTATGQDVLSLSCPPAVAEWGALIGVLSRSDLPGHRNYVPNPALRLWSGAGTTAPDGWSAVGSPTLSRLTAGPQLVRGSAALQVDTTISGSGIATPSAAIAPRESAPYLSGYCTLWVLSGQVRVEIVALTAASVEKVYPLGGNLATSQKTGIFEDLGAAGIDAKADTLVAARLRVVQHGTAPASWILASAQLTLDASDGQLPYVEGSGGNALWQAANIALQTRAIPRLVTTVALVDLARLDGSTFGDDCTVIVGQTVRVVYSPRGIDGTARLVKATFDYVAPGRTAITLSDRPEELSGSLARRSSVPRRIPRAPIIVLAGDVNATTAFDGAGALSILVDGPLGADSLRAAVSTSSMPTATAVDAATGTLRADGVEIGVLTSAGPYAPGDIVFIAVRAYRGGVGSRVLQLTDAADAADAAQGPSLEVRYTQTSTQVQVSYAAIGTVTYRVNDTLTTLPASPFIIARPSALAAPFVGALYCTRNGLVVSEALVVPAIGVDTVTPDIEVEAVSTGNLRDTVAFKVRGYERSGRSLTLTRTMLLTGCSAIGFSGVGPHTLSQDQQVQIIKPLAANVGTVRFAVTTSDGGRVEQSRTIPARDLTGIGVEVLSNPEFRADLPRREGVYDNGSTGLISLSYPAVSGQNASGVALRISKAAGSGTTPGSGGFTLTIPRNATAGFVADSYREGALYLITLRALIPSGLSIEYQSNPIGTGASFEWLSSVAGTNQYEDYVLRLQIGVGGTLSATGYFNLASVNIGVVVWDVARISWLDLSLSERQPVVGLSATITSSDAVSVTVVVMLSPATASSVVYLSTYTDANTGGAAIGVGVANGSVWVFPRRAFRTGNGSATFGGRTPGFEPATVSLVIPEQGRDTVPLGLQLTRVGGDATSDIVRVTPTDPFPQGTGTLTLTILAAGLTVSPTGPLSMTSGTPVDVTITRPAVASDRTIVGFVLSNANRATAWKEFGVEPVRPLTPGRVIVTSIALSGATATVNWQAFNADGTQSTATADVAVRYYETPGGGTEGSATDPGVAFSTSVFFSNITRVAGASYRVQLIFDPATPNGTARTEVFVTIPIYNPGAIDGVPRFSAVTINVPGSFAAMTCNFTPVDAPSGALYNATVTLEDVITKAPVNVTSGFALGRNGQAASGGIYTALRKASVRMSMTDTNGNELATRVSALTNFYEPP
ncbi:MAG: hypothetical protein H7099_06265 [Gemmatimonadaceae bacterium]|nr:hypothetical protein [Gemmatimonadaceae bacterium]